MKKMDDRGVTLIELIIVVAIMAVLSGFVTMQLLHYVERARKAQDVNTADTIGRAYMIAAASHPDVYFLMEDWRTSKYSNLQTTVTATVNGKTESYKVALIVASENTTFTGKQGEYMDGFYETLNGELGLRTGKNAYNKEMVPRHKVKKSGAHSSGEANRSYSKVDRWRIVERVDNGQIEVWSADGSKFGGWPQFRVWPDPDDEYRN